MLLGMLDISHVLEGSLFNGCNYTILLTTYTCSVFASNETLNGNQPPEPVLTYKPQVSLQNCFSHPHTTAHPQQTIKQITKRILTITYSILSHIYTISPTNVSESSQAKSHAAAATQTSSNNPALNDDAKYAQAMKEYNQAMEDRENEFKARCAEKIEQLNIAYEKIHTKLMSFADISTREKLTVQDFRKLG